MKRTYALIAASTVAIAVIGTAAAPPYGGLIAATISLVVQLVQEWRHQTNGRTLQAQIATVQAVLAEITRPKRWSEQHREDEDRRRRDLSAQIAAGGGNLF
jgi:hypothetical protein